MSNRRYYVYMKSGRKFCVEEYGDPHVSWGNVIPGQNKIEKVSSKMSEVIDDSNTIITKENGYKNICMFEMGTSPMAYIDAIDSSGVERLDELKCVTYLD
jgi:hypothetical protein